MKIVITGTASGVGFELAKKLQHHNVTALTRDELDLSDINAVINYDLGICDMLINCAATGVGGKIDFVNHKSYNIVNIMNTNLLSPVLLSKQALANNANCKIINITSTNNNRYYPGDLAYSLSKQALADFGAMLKIEYPDVQYLEVRLGLTKTNFNNNRYRNDLDRFIDVYANKHLTVDNVTDRILDVLFDSSIKTIEVAL
jgi:short-subunit dehydrogenase